MHEVRDQERDKQELCEAEMRRGTVKTRPRISKNCLGPSGAKTFKPRGNMTGR